MVYLENKTELQELWIPRNDGQGVPYNPTKDLEGVDVTISQDITVVHPSSGYYGMSAVTIDATEYGQQNYDSGFDDGYTDGYASGSTEGYESGYTSGYTSGSTDGYNSGYTSGETHQKSLLVSTAITQNGSYQRENGYSAITVNVPTGQTYNIEENKQFVVNANGNYTIKPTSGITTINDHFDSDVDRYYITATTSGYPLTGKYYLFYIEDEFDSSKGQIDVYIENGYLDYNDIGWDGGEIIDWDTGDRLVLEISNANRDFEWYPLEDFSYHYDVMSAVSLTVNVPQTGSTNSIISVTGNTWYVLDHYFGTGEQIEITNATFDYSVANVARHQQLIAGGDGEWVRIGGAGDVFYTSYYGDNKITSHTILDDDHILLKNGEFYVNDMETPVSIFSLSPLDIFKDTRMVVFANTASGGDSVCGQTASVGIITIYDENDNVVDKYIPELHNGVVCLHNVISGNYITPSGTGTPTITNTDYSEGYIDGRQDVINTFTAITATTNGVYGSSANPLSSITVNVPQTGHTDQELENAYASGQTSIINTFTAMTATTNGVYGSSANPLSAITVNVPTGSTSYSWVKLTTDIGSDVPIRKIRINAQACEDAGVTVFGNLYFSRGVSGITQAVISDYNNDPTSGYPWNNRFGIVINNQDYTDFSNSWFCYNGGVNRPTDGGDGYFYYEYPSDMYFGFSSSQSNFTELDANGYYEVWIEVSDYDFGYNSGYTDGYSSGYTSGTTDGFNSGYTSGHTDGYEEAISDVIDSAETLTVSANGSYATSLIADGHLWNEVVVNVPQTVSGYSIDDIATGITCSNPIITQKSVYTNAFYNGFLTGTLTFSGNNNPNLGYCEIECYSFAAQHISNIVFDPNYNYVLLNGAFCVCMQLTALTIPNNVSLYYNTNELPEFEKGTFEMCQSLIVINVNSPRIAKKAFYNCSITAATIGQNVQQIDELSLGGNNLSIIYSYATTAPNMHQYATSNEFYDSWPLNGTVHYPAGSDYSSWQQLTCFSTWTFIGDL